MGIHDIYSKRQSKTNDGIPDVYVYDEIPQPLRVQIMHILRDGFGTQKNRNSDLLNGVYGKLHNMLTHEYGLEHLPQGHRRGIHGEYKLNVENFLLTTKSCERVLDVVELAMQLMEHYQGQPSYVAVMNIATSFATATEELNYRFREHSVGYQFEAGEIIRVDSQFIHSEAVKPTLLILSDQMYAGANQEFLKAHEHYRHGEYKECLNECLKAFESTMKAICDKRGWAYDNRDTASRLIGICFDNGLVPSFLQSQFSSLRASLESGIPTTRNRLGGHGQGSQPVTVPNYLAGYLLHLTASTILMLDKAEKELP